MTEDEAKTKWCPMAKAAGTFEVDDEEMGFSASNRIGNPFDKAPIEFKHATRCIASECMMWVEGEWVKTPILGQEGHFTNEPSGRCGLIKC